MLKFKQASLFYYKTQIKITPDDHFIKGMEMPESFDPEMSNEELAEWLQAVCTAIGAKAGYSPTHGISFKQKPEDTEVSFVNEHRIEFEVEGKMRVHSTPDYIYCNGKGWTAIFEEDGE